VNDQSIEVAKTIQAAYDEQYDDRMTEWRELGGKYKAANILNVCKGYRFSKVLDCGAGEGSVLNALNRSSAFSDLYAIEISDSAIAQINKRELKKLKEVKKFNGYEIPYSDKEFDMVYCSHVIEHVEHPRILLREIQRVSEFQVFEIPLDYSIEVDEKVDHFLSYGHISVYTPSLFKFLLKSEGYEIVAEVLAKMDNEVLRFNMYKNMGLEKTMMREIVLNLRPFRDFLKRVKLGKKHYKEYGYSTYTCLTKGGASLSIF
jgi:ubiquinone/menaquinone biosynthesis C-methylase UbiE